MSNKEYLIDSYEHDDTGQWYASIIEVSNGLPVYVYKVKADKPLLVGEAEQ